MFWPERGPRRRRGHGRSAVLAVVAATAVVPAAGSTGFLVLGVSTQEDPSRSPPRVPTVSPTPAAPPKLP